MQSSPYYSSMVGLGLAEKPKKKKKYKEIKEPNFQIEVTLINAEIHTGFDSDGLADGYVKVKGLNRDSGSGKLFYTGPVGDHSLSPQWNHIKTIKFNPNKYCGLIFDMYDKDPILNSDDFIGRLVTTIFFVPQLSIADNLRDLLLVAVRVYEFLTNCTGAYLTLRQLFQG
eukprot:TRINITY_DN2131_c0_g3_i3.p1 TRINITY_DN2131_c0_g3~~TRINITY_DN2131_c0_g3_i3.p1  ORF type:complete len:170 (-),score=26.20 TRINITY_DN2131_c0_g3_i3:354-863(-)